MFTRSSGACPGPDRTRMSVPYVGDRCMVVPRTDVEAVGHSLPGIVPCVPRDRRYFSLSVQRPLRNGGRLPGTGRRRRHAPRLPIRVRRNTALNRTSGRRAGKVVVWRGPDRQASPPTARHRPGARSARRSSAASSDRGPQSSEPGEWQQ